MMQLANNSLKRKNFRTNLFFCGSIFTFCLTAVIRGHANTANCPISREGKNAKVQFATFAFVGIEMLGGGGERWDIDTAERALRVMYSSLVQSQRTLPTLHVFTNVPKAIPTKTTMGTAVDIVVHVCTPVHFPENPYSHKEKWKALSRSKLDAVERILLNNGGRVIWIDLDTLVFVDLMQSFQHSSSWFVGYQHGSCGGRNDCIRGTGCST